MQCKPGVAFIPRLMTKSAKHPLNHSGAGLAGKFSYLLYALSRRRDATLNQPNKSQRRKQ